MADLIPESLGALRVPLGSLKPFAANPRQGDVGAIVASLEAHGQYRPIVVNKRSMEVLAGNHTLRAARELGWGEIAATFVDVDDETAARIVLVDNRSNDLASYDDRALVDLLRSLPDLEGTGFDGDALDELLEVLDPVEPGRDTEPGEPPAEPVTKPGDLVVLGEHRLLCGSSMLRESVAVLMDDELADVMVTDPPYGVSFGNDKGKQSISGDLTQAAIPVSFAVAIEVLVNDGRLYLFGGSQNWAMYAGLFDAHLRMQVRPIVWVKESFVLRPNGYHSQFEMVYYGWKGAGGKHWYGDRKSSDVWDVSRREDADRVHPTQKPIEVCEIPIRNSCPPGGLVYEPFGGSGSTLIACENLNRRCYAMEIDPGYCDVIVDRWERHTGKTAERITDGSPVAAHA